VALHVIRREAPLRYQGRAAAAIRDVPRNTRLTVAKNESTARDCSSFRHASHTLIFALGSSSGTATISLPGGGLRGASSGMMKIPFRQATRMICASLLGVGLNGTCWTFGEIPASA